MSPSRKNWTFALLLTLPMVVLYAGMYFNHSRSLVPTGFVGDDNVSYVANAKEYLDRDRFSLFYANPLNDSANYPSIYFQPQTILMALLLLLGWAPGFVIVFLNWVGTLFSFRMAIALYDHLYPVSRKRKLMISFFCWGGGLLVLACLPIALFRPMGNADFMERLFFIDPGAGWWGLNFGRGHFVSTEGYYHFLFLSGMVCILKRKWNWALLAALVLSLSHPFTGIEYLGIVTLWGLYERIAARNKTVPWAFITGMILITAFHLWYYLVYLNRFPEHRSVSDQYSLNWRLRFFSMIPAYCIVATLAIASLLRQKKELLTRDSTRLFLAWFLVSFLLANHELFIKPMQPLHFTRGYVWASLFLLGIPALQEIFRKEGTKKYRVALVLFSVLFFSDNLLWIINMVRSTYTTPSVIAITREQKQLFALMAENSDNKTLVIGKDEVLVYMSAVYTKAYPWISHPFTTPFAARKDSAYRAFIVSGRTDPLWKGRQVILVFHKDNPAEMQRSKALSFPSALLADTPSYIIEKGMIP